MFTHRGSDRRVRHLQWRVRIFGAGAILGVAGIASETGWLVNVAIGVLAVGVLIRFIPERDEGRDEGEDADAADPGESGE